MAELDSPAAPGPLVHLCVKCQQVAQHWVQQENRSPEPMCETCLFRLQTSMELAEERRLEAIAGAKRRKQRKAQRNARRRSR